jgi:hypothetical protein
MPAEDRRYGPFGARADPNYPKSSHKSDVGSILACSKEASETGIRSPSGGAVDTGSRTRDAVSSGCTGGVRQALQMMIPRLACSVELITVDSQLHPPRLGALLTDPETFETLVVPRVGVTASLMASMAAVSAQSRRRTGVSRQLARRWTSEPKLSLARPTGLEPVDAMNIRIPIESQREADRQGNCLRPALAFLARRSLSDSAVRRTSRRARGPDRSCKRDRSARRPASGTASGTPRRGCRTAPRRAASRPP